MSLLHLLFGFSGRINRAKFWLAVVLWIVFWAIAVPICVLAAFMILGLHLPDSLASLAISIWGLVELGFLRGTVGPNQYGPDPLQTPSGAGPSIAPASAGP
jgi:uncharacterized membrane protein YhaH (DUF805 family)